jgi:hypothetical protein
MATIRLFSRTGFARLARFAFAVATLVIPVTARAETSAFPPPVVVVYPFTVSGSTTDPQAGGNLAVLLSNGLQALGGVEVKPFTPGTGRPDFLIAAQKQNADYYVTGFLTPIGPEFSLITQVVSTYGGSVVWSNSITIRTYKDALAEADALHGAILTHAQRSLSSIAAQPVEPTPQPVTSDAAGVNLTKALGRHHRDAPSPAPSASAPAAAVALAGKPAGALITNAGGSADPSLRARASNALSAALAHDGIGGGGINVSGNDAVANAAQLCKANPGNGVLYVPTLVLGGTDSGTVGLDVAAYDCTGKPIGAQHDVEESGRRLSVQAAIDRAAAKIADAFAKSAAVAK